MEPRYAGAKPCIALYLRAFYRGEALVKRVPKSFLAVGCVFRPKWNGSFPIRRSRRREDAIKTPLTRLGCANNLHFIGTRPERLSRFTTAVGPFPHRQHGIGPHLVQASRTSRMKHWLCRPPAESAGMHSDWAAAKAPTHRTVWIKSFPGGRIHYAIQFGPGARHETVRAGHHPAHSRSLSLARRCFIAPGRPSTARIRPQVPLAHRTLAKRGRCAAMHVYVWGASVRRGWGTCATAFAQEAFRRDRRRQEACDGPAIGWLAVAGLFVCARRGAAPRGCPLREDGVGS